VRVSFFAHTALGNAIGRTYSLWLLTEELGWDARIHVPDADRVWAPLQDEKRFRSCFRTSIDEAGSSDVLVAVKPLPGSFGLALRVRARTGHPLVLDVDDPDWEWAFGFHRRHAFVRAARRILRGRPAFPVDGGGTNRRPHLAAYRESRLRGRARHLGAVAISNPTLSRWYPGTLVPHVRVPVPVPSASQGAGLRVAFVGTPRQHKGIEVLRSAARSVDGVRLLVTAAAPPDASSNEEWIGETSLAAGLRLVGDADVVALPSLDTGYARYQFPVKVIDAMLAERAIVASDLAPLRWAAEGAALFVPPGDVESLARALDRLRDPTFRESLGRRGRSMALARFTPQAVAPAFAGLIEEAGRQRRHWWHR